MPEYLAPAVYVEEVSFRSKPLEGVSTSTTAFVGPTATGPIDDIPELLTSVGDYERVYGGTTSLGFGPNYMAHAVRGFFDNGGRRLYVARTFQAGAGDGIARSAFLVNPDGSAPNVRVVARFPGAAGKGKLQLREERVPTTETQLDGAPQGTMIRIGAADPATPSTAIGGRLPRAVPNGAVMILTVSETPTVVTFRGEPAQVTGTPTLTDDLFTVDSETVPLTVEISGSRQTLVIPEGSYTLQQLADELNRTLRGGFAVADSGTDIIIGSEVRGTAASVTIIGDNDFGFTPGDSNSRAASTDDTVPDLGNVTATDLRDALTDAGAAVTVSVGLDLRVRISTIATGSTATLAIANQGSDPSAADALDFDLGAAPPGTSGSTIRFFVKRGTGYVDSTGASLPSGDLGGIELLSLNAVAVDGEGRSKNFEDLAYDPNHPRYIGNVLSAAPPRRSDALENRLALQVNADTSAISWPFTLRNALLGSGAENVIALSTGGDDGLEPTGQRFTEALERLRSIEDISIIAAPGSSALAEVNAIRAALITHVERSRAYQIAVLDTPAGVSFEGARTYRADIDSKYAALYYPWLRIPNPDLRPGDISTPREIDVPPSGHVCGIYARNDAERGVHKAPANEVVRGVVTLETFVNFAQQERLNPAGVNAIRFFPGRGFRVWGARLVSSDPEWKYVSLRRYFNYLEASIDRGTQYIVFEPNGPRLWLRVRNTISDFLFSEWRNGALLGNAPGEAFFVRCDRTTMTQNDLDNGRLIVEVGIAVVNPAEFVIFRIGQKTADARS